MVSLKIVAHLYAVVTWVLLALLYPPTVIGTENCCMKTGSVPSFPGYMKSNRDHNSFRLFCSGEPDNIRRCEVENCFTANVIWASGLRILCPSSRMTESKLYQKIGSDTTNDTIDQLEQNLQNKADMIEDLQHQKSDLEKSIDDLKNRIEALQEANNEELEAVQAANEALKVRIEELETSTEQEDNSQKVQQLNDKMVALRNKAKEYLKKSKELQSKNEDLEKQLEEAKQSDEKDDLAEEQISLLQEMLKQKTLELSSVNDAMDSLKVVHHEEMTTQVEICSSLNEQLSKLSEDLSENLQEKADLEGQMENIKTQVQDQLEGQTKTIENWGDKKKNIIK